MPSLDHHDSRTAHDESWSATTAAHATASAGVGHTPTPDGTGIGTGSSTETAGAMSHWAEGRVPAAGGVHLGSKGPAVEKLQQELNARGQEPPLKISGVFDSQTQVALRAFQKKSGVPASGTLDPATQSALDSAERKPEIAATADAMGRHVAGKMDMANGKGPYNLDAGIHYSYNYEAECEDAGQKSRWSDDMRYGYADPQYFERLGFMDWRLKPGRSASAGIRAWLRGLTVAECNSSVVAMQIDALRAAIGDHKFDDHHGAADQEVPQEQLLRIKPGTDGTPVDGMMRSPDMLLLKQKKAAAGQKLTDDDMNKTLKIGEWYYFYNHPKYLLKHPGGAWQGENSLYMGVKSGQRMWSGLGASNVSEDGMFREMVSAYNAPRDANDERAMKESGAKHGETYSDKKYDPHSGSFPDRVTKDMILSDPAFSGIDGTNRKGGFLAEAGTTLDEASVKRLRDEPDTHH